MSKLFAVIAAVYMIHKAGFIFGIAVCVFIVAILYDKEHVDTPPDHRPGLRRFGD